MLRSWITFILACVVVVSMGQSPAELAAKSELTRRGLDERRVVEELNKRGIDLNKIDPRNPAEVQAVEKEILEVLDFLEKENKTIKRDSTNKANQEKIKNIEAKVIENTSQTPNPTQPTKEKTPEAPKYAIYGHHIFKDNSIQVYNTSNQIKPSKNYLIGAGDVLSISIWGVSEANFALEVEEDGYIKPDRLPRIYVSGLTVEQAKKVVTQRLRSSISFNPNNFELKVISPRNLAVSIFGEVETVGSFNILATNSVFNALVAAGGPNNIGSVRNIKLLRAGKKPQIIDVYQYLKNPQITPEFYLQDNDILHVPIAQKVIAISGGVQKPHRFELLEKENLLAIIDYAGGLKPNAIRKNVRIKRIEGDEPVLLNVDLTSLSAGKKDFALLPGDEIEIDTLVSSYLNKVMVSGAVYNEGEFALEPNTKISDLLKKVLLKENAILETTFLKRLNPDRVTVRYQIINLAQALAQPSSTSDLVLENGDEIIIRARSEFSDLQNITIEGSVRKPGAYPLGDRKSLRVSDAIFLSGGIQEDAMPFAYVFRKDQKTDEPLSYFFVDLNTVAEDENDPSNIALIPNDSIHIYPKSFFTEKLTVSITGAVRKAGTFPYSNTLRLRDLLLLAGGLTQSAAFNRIEVYRVNIDRQNNTKVVVKRISLRSLTELETTEDFVLQPYDEVYVRKAPDFELPKKINVSGAITYPGTYVLTESNKISDIIRLGGGYLPEAYLGGATLFRTANNTGFVVIDLESALKNPNSAANVIVEEGDEIYIPFQSSIVSIEGATNFAELYPDSIAPNGRINVAFEKNKSAKYYVTNFAAGFNEKADLSKVVVISQSGKVSKTKKFLFFRSYPEVTEGSTIRVPAKPEKILREGQKEKEDVDWGKVLSNSIAQATAILSLILLLQRID